MIWKISLGAGVICILAALVWGVGYARIGLPVGTGFAAKQLCSLVFVAGGDPDWVFDQYVAQQIAPLGPLLGRDVDFEARQVSASVFGLYRATAIHRRGLGCTLIRDRDLGSLHAEVASIPELPDAIPPLLPWPGGEAPLVDPPPPALTAAIDEAFREPGGPARQTQAVVVARSGRLIAERYAEGYGPESPMLSWSVAKSVTAALIGIAEARGLFRLYGPAPVPEWLDADGRSTRPDIDLRSLLQMSSGLEFDEIYRPGSDSTRMLFREADMGLYAAMKPRAAPPGHVFNYSSGTANLLCRILRQATGGELADVVRFSREALFEPVGMTSARFEPDASGSFVGSSYLFATARDYARFGELHRRDGVWLGKRVLPESWVDFVTTPNPVAPEGRYGAHWWLNAGEPDDPGRRRWPTLPKDLYAATGHSGQFIMVVPSQELVVVRNGLSQPGADYGIIELVESTIEALGEAGQGVEIAIGRGNR